MLRKPAAASPGALVVTRPVPGRAERWAALLDVSLKGGDARLIAVIMNEIQAEGLLLRGSSSPDTPSADIRTQGAVALSVLRQRVQGATTRPAR